MVAVLLLHVDGQPRLRPQKSDSHETRDARHPESERPLRLEPERIAQRLVDWGYATRYEHAVQALRELPYAKWREYDAEDAVRFYALRLHEARMIKSTPQRII